MAQRTDRVLPHAKSRMAQFLDKKIDGLKGEVSQRDIATALGYERANLISMFKTGESKVPLDKIPALAKAIKVDPAHLMRLGLEQYWKEEMRVINEVFANLATKHEMRLIEAFRSATRHDDPEPTPDQLARVKEIFRSHK